VKEKKEIKAERKSGERKRGKTGRCRKRERESERGKTEKYQIKIGKN
jgi:hypothetical protein